MLKPSILLLILTSCLIKAQTYRRPRIRNKLLNETYYLGTAYEYAYDKTYWTIAIIKYYNSTFNGTSDVFVQTSYTFFNDWWAGSSTNQIMFKLNPVNYFFPCAYFPKKFFGKILLKKIFNLFLTIFPLER